MVLFKNRGSNKNSHGNNPVKPKSQHRKRFNLSCSADQYEQISKILDHVRPMERSAYIIKAIETAIAKNYTNLSEKPEDKKGMFQISCTPGQKQQIDDFVTAKIPDKCRSRWIIEAISAFA